MTAQTLKHCVCSFCTAIVTQDAALAAPLDRTYAAQFAAVPTTPYFLYTFKLSCGSCILWL